MLSTEDMIRLIETEGEINQMDKVFEQLAGHGHDVIQHNAHPAYSGSEEADQKFIEILYDRKRTPDERAEILLSGRA